MMASSIKILVFDKFADDMSGHDMTLLYPGRIGRWDIDEYITFFFHHAPTASGHGYGDHSLPFRFTEGFDDIDRIT